MRGHSSARGRYSTPSPLPLMPRPRPQITAVDGAPTPHGSRVAQGDCRGEAHPGGPDVLPACALTPGAWPSADWLTEAVLPSTAKFRSQGPPGGGRMGACGSFDA